MSTKFPYVQFRNDEYHCLCPWHDDKRPSLFINLYKDKAICFAGCYQGSAGGAIKKLLGYVPSDLVGVFEAVPTRYTQSLHKVVTSLGEVKDYLKGRGFTDSTLEGWEIGANGEFDCAIPVKRRDGTLVGTIYRRIEPGAVPKYLYSPGFKASKCLFGLSHFDNVPQKKVYVVEGPLDCIWMWQCGYNNTVALLGSSLSLYQQKLLRRIGDTVVLCLDNDGVGVSSTSKIANKLLSQGHQVLVKVLMTGHKDVQDHTKEELDSTKDVPYLLWVLNEGVKR